MSAVKLLFQLMISNILTVAVRSLLPIFFVDKTAFSQNLISPFTKWSNTALKCDCKLIVENIEFGLCSGEQGKNFLSLVFSRFMLKVTFEFSGIDT